MLGKVDAFFSVLPAFIIAYHCLGVLYQTGHLECLAHIAFTYFESALLKTLLKRERRMKSYVYKPIIFTERLGRFKSNYGFPSSHSMFYFQYFLYYPSVPTFLMFIFGASLRIICEHHTRTEVFFGCLIVLLTKTAFRILYMARSFLK